MDLCEFEAKTKSKQTTEACTNHVSPETTPSNQELSSLEKRCIQALAATWKDVAVEKDATLAILKKRSPLFLAEFSLACLSEEELGAAKRDKEGSHACFQFHNKDNKQSHLREPHPDSVHNLGGVGDFSIGASRAPKPKRRLVRSRRPTKLS